MSEISSGRPRRSTRNSTQSSQGSNTSCSQQTPTSTTSNPYKKPTYLASRDNDSPSTSTPSRGRGRGRGRGSRGGSNGNGSTALSRTKASKPECVATRVESRRSTGGSSASAKKRRRGGYNTNDFHYGSDFDDSDQGNSDPEERAEDDPGSDDSESGSAVNSRDDEGGESDSDLSVISSLKLSASGMPSPPVPLWMDNEKEIEELDLPKSSDDLLLNRDLVMKAVAVYEPLRRFHQIVRLTPFRFEDFCAALGVDEQSSLLTEIHIQLLKTILREDDANGTLFGPNEVKDSVQAVLFFIDNLTWPECLRSYLESDANWTNLHKEFCSIEYPFCGPEIRIKVLSWMVDLFLASNPVREALLSEGTILHEDHCRSCNRLGELICCETCPATYHLQCMVPPLKIDEDPPDDWKCPVCIKHRIAGIMDCASELEKAGLLIRHEKLGYDRHGRKYWFLARRILIESEDGSSVWYYTTPLQVEELLYRLDEDNYESELVENIRMYKEEIVRQMEITEHITDEVKASHRKTYIEAENTFLKKIHEQREEALEKEIQDRKRKEEEAVEAEKAMVELKSREEDEKQQKDEAERKRIREERLHRRNQNKFGEYEKYPFDDLDQEMTPSELDDSAEERVNHSATDIKEEDAKPTISTNEENIPKLLSATDSQMDTAETQLLEDEIKQETPAENTEASKEICEFKPEAENIISSTTADTDVKPKIENKRKSRALLLDWDTDERMTRLKATGLYKLGQEGNYRTYTNLYANDALALGKAHHAEERDRKRHMSHKFSITPASEIKWANLSNGYRSTLVSSLRSALGHMENAFPTTLMHVNWPILRKAWISAVSASSNPKDFSKAMVALAACLRPACYNPLWTESLGHCKLTRMGALEREERKKAEKRDKKDRDDDEDRLRLLPQYCKYTLPIKHQVYKQKGEEYRIHGRWGWVWLATPRRCKPQDCRKQGLLGGPFKHVIQVKNDSGKVKTILIDPPVFEKLMAKRSNSQRNTPSASPMKPTPGQSNKKATESVVSGPPNASLKAELESNKDSQPEVIPEVTPAASPKVEPSEADEKSESAIASTEALSTESSSEESLTKSMQPPLDSDIKLEPEESEIKQESDETPQTDNNTKDDKDTEKTDAEEVVEDVKEIKQEQEDDCVETEVQDDPPVSTSTDVEMKQEPDTPKEQEDVKPEIKQEKIDEESKVNPPLPTSSSSSSDELHKSAIGRKLELVNVSLGIVSANRIVYPKIAHKVPVLDSLLERRIKLQKLEDEELLATYGQEKLEKVRRMVAGEVIKEEEPTFPEPEVLSPQFPLAGIYKFQCYSFYCQSAADEFMNQTATKVREYECKCYSPMCRLKYFVQQTQRRKEEAVKKAEKDQLDKMVQEVLSKRMFTQTESSAKVYLKQLPEQLAKKRNSVKYPMTSTFRTAGSKEPSILMLPQFELKRLARSGGRSFTPVGFAPAPKTGSWAWPYPCGRPLFRTSWQFKAVHANTLAAAALQLRILWASIKWDDIQMKMPNSDGKNQITTDMEIITTEILKHRIIGRFMERVQYLRKKTVVPIDAPKTIRAYNRDSSEVTPSRSGLRKRKRAESPDSSDPVVTEEWVDEDKVELWEIKFYGERQDRKPEPKSITPATRTKSGLTLIKPEKFDPSTEDKETPKKEKVCVTKTAEIMKEQLETELKMQRAVHLSKRDNHPKTITTINKAPTPTASQQLQQQQAAAGLPANPRSYSGASGSVGQKKLTMTKFPGGNVTTAQESTPNAAIPILNRKTPVAAKPAVSTPTTTPTGPTQKITVYRAPDGKLQVRGLLPGQTVYQTQDGKICLAGTPIKPMQAGTPTQTILMQQPNNPGQTILIQGQPGQLQQNTTPGVIHVGSSSGTITPTGQIQMTQVANQPLINISNPAIRTVITSSAANSSPNLIKSPVILQQQVQIASPLQPNQTQLLHTYATPKNSRKVSPKGNQISTTPTAIAPAVSLAQTQQVTGTINAQGQIVIRGPLPAGAQLTPQGQFVMTSGSTPILNVSSGTITTSNPQGTIVVSSGAIMGGTGSLTPIVTTSSSTAGAGGVIQVQTTTPATTAASNPSRVVFQDGNKTIVVSGGANLTTQQLQQIIQLQLKKVQGSSPNAKIQPQILQQVITTPAVGGQSPQQQQPQQQIQLQQGSMQIIQQPGQQIQLIGAQGLQQLQQLQQQGQSVLIQGVGGHQIATIGGQPVLVKKIAKSPTKPSAPTTPTSSSAPSTSNILQISGGTTPAQLQQLLASGKSVIRVDPKTGTVGITAAALQQLQSQSSSSLQPQSTITTSSAQQPMIVSTTIQGQQQQPGSTTVTRTSGLPISIVSPSKNTKIVPTSIAMLPQSSQARPLAPTPYTTTVVTNSSSIRQLPTATASTSIQQQQQQLSPSKPQSPLISLSSPTTQVVSAVPGPQVVSTIVQSQQQQISIQSPTTVQQLPQSPTLGGNSLSHSPQKQVTATVPSVVASVAPPVPKLPGRIVAQFVQSATGPKVVLTGIKQGDLSAAQLQSIQAQLQKQFVEQQLAQKNLQIGSHQGQMKIVVQQQPQQNQLIAPAPSPSPSITMTVPDSETVKIVSPTKSDISPTVSTKLQTSPPQQIQQPIIGVKSQPVFIQSPTKASPIATTKSPPNSANIDAAIDAVALDVDAPVIVPTKPSPKKSAVNSVNQPRPTSPNKSKSKVAAGIQKNVLGEDATTIATTSPSPTKSPKKRSPQKKTQPATPPILTPLEPSFVPQPIEQDVVISTTETHEIQSAANSESTIDGPRFVLSQDLMTQGTQNMSEFPPTSASMTFFQGQQKPTQQKISTPSSALAPRTNIITSTPRAQPKGSSRRKSPIKTFIESPTKQVKSPQSNKITMSPMASPKMIASLHKHKEMLKKDICKKRGLLEKELFMDIQKEISEERGKKKSPIRKSESPDITAKPGGMKRKSSESKPKESGDGKRKTGIANARPTAKKAKRSAGSGSKLYCICKTPYDNTKFYVGCDICSNWYHGDCIGITEEMSKSINDYVCDECKEETDKVYCLCRQPYDESQFYICCDTCEDWFHGRCVGILQSEGDSIKEYVCPNCDPNTDLNHANLKTLEDNDYPLISKLLKQIQSHKCAWPFVDPVDPSEAPNYYRLIKDPMDLQTVEFRVEEKLYKKLRDFIGDITKIFENCRYYNPSASPFFRSAETLEAFFAQKLALLRQTFATQK